MKGRTVFLIILFVAIIIGFVSHQQAIIDKLYLLMGNKTVVEEHRKTLAAITDLNRNVKLKKMNTTVWDIAEKGLRLALQDTLSTSLASDAIVTFDTGYNFKLGENSLIVIENPNEEKKKLIVLSLGNGVVQGKNGNDDDSTVRIKTGNIITEIKGKASFGVRMREDKVAEVWVNQGKAKVSDTKGQEDEISENEHKQYPSDELPQLQKIIVIDDKEKTKKEDINFVSTGDSEGKEGLSGSIINQIISKHRKKINNCYDKSQVSGKGNKVVVHLIIGNKGDVSSVNIPSSSLGDPGIEECIKFWIRSIKFPQFKGDPVSESVQFVFE
jgi:hypothetical protein